MDRGARVGLTEKTLAICFPKETARKRLAGGGATEGGARTPATGMCMVPLNSEAALPVALRAQSLLLVKAPWKERLEGLRELAEPPSPYQCERSRKLDSGRSPGGQGCPPPLLPLATLDCKQLLSHLCP